MPNIGEEFVGECLQALHSCDFVSYNLNNPIVQGELDVVGISLVDETIYFCEVATHLVTGIQYTKDNRPDFEKIYDKFIRNKQYAEQCFKEYKRHVFMLWSPVVKDGKNSQLKKLQEIQHRLRANGIELELVVNERYKQEMDALSEYAASKTEELRSPILRFMQIQAYLDKHLKRLERQAKKNVSESQESRLSNIKMPPPGFPHERQPLTSAREIVAFVDKWKPIWKRSLSEIECSNFAEECWRIGFIYEPNELFSDVMNQPLETLRHIAVENDVLAMGDALFSLWRVLNHGDYVTFDSGELDCILAIMDRIKEMAMDNMPQGR